MTQSIGYVLHARFIFAQESQKFVYKNTIRGLIARADVVNLTWLAVLKCEMNTRTVIIDVDPIAFVKSVTI